MTILRRYRLGPSSTIPHPTQGIASKVMQAVAMAFVSLAASLGQPYCDVRTFTIRDGLAANLISGFSQSGDGLMWFATWNGLCCYDGYHFYTFRNTPGEDNVLTTNRIMIVKPSATGHMWCCTSDRRLYLFNTHTSRFVDVGHMIERQYGTRLRVRNIYPLANGHTWVMSHDGGPSYRVTDSLLLSGQGIEQYNSTSHGKVAASGLKKAELDADGGEWLFGTDMLTLVGTNFAMRQDMEHLVEMDGVTLLASENGHAYVFDRKKMLATAVPLPQGVTRINSALRWTEQKAALATNRGIVAVSMSAQGPHTELIAIQRQPRLQQAEPTHLFVDSKHRLWAFTTTTGIVLISPDEHNQRWLTATAESPLAQTSSEKPFIHQDEHGTVWMVPQGGTFCYYDELHEQLVPYPIRSGRTGIHPLISKFGIDKQGNLWFTGTRDVCLVNFKYHHFKLTPISPSHEVRALLIDRQERTWAGTNNGQLALLDKQLEPLGCINQQGKVQAQPTFFAHNIYTLFEDHHGRIWIGTKGSGLYILTPGGTIEHHTHNPTDNYSISGNEIYDIASDSHGNIWVGSYNGGLNLVDEKHGNIRFINHRNQLSQYPIKDFSHVRRIDATGHGYVILSTTNGLVTFANNFNRPQDIRFHTTSQIPGDTTSLMAPDVLQTIVTKQGRVLVATLGGGLQMVTDSVLLRDGLRFGTLPGAKPAEGIVQSLAEDSNGHLWIVRENSIDQYDLSTGKLLQYGPGNIGEGIELSEAKPARNPATNRISVAARGGFVSFCPKDLKKSTHKPGIVFTQVLYHGNGERKPILGADILDVPAGRRNLTIYFSALEYTSKDLVEYAYQIEGKDEGWNYVGHMGSASFNRLPAGRYRLLVKSTNSDGVWTDNVTALNIHAHPTFWETGWAVAMWVALAFMAIYVAIAIYRLRAKARMERELSQMKTQFFTEISHKLRTPLTLIGEPVTEVLRQDNLNATARNHLEMVQRNASHMLALVNKMLKYGRQQSVYISDDNAAEHTAFALATDNASTPQADRGTKLLVVEDNDDLRQFLVSILQGEYTVMQANNGQQGLDMAKQQMPDFIITDVMMPVMDGLTMVRHIKQNKDICHIPIIVLSAKASLEDRLQGLNEGIDDYITKPFSATYLKTRVANIIVQRRMLQQNYVGQLNTENHATYKLQSPQIADADNEMMRRLMSYIEQHIGQADLRIEDLASAAGLGRSVFYGKVKSIVGMTPLDFLRHLRIQQAEELIKKSNYTISQIAYSVGFSDPKYFGRCFKKETGMTPSEYRERAMNDNPDT